MRQQAATPDENMLRDLAVGWKVRLQSGAASSTDWEACQRWQNADPAHARAWERLHGITHLFSQLPAQLARSTLAHADRDTTRQQRRSVLKSLLLVTGTAGAAGLGWSGYRWLPWQDLVADYSTAIGKQLRVTLADTSQVTLNTRSAIQVTLDTWRRDIALLRGEILVRVAAAIGSAPLRVITAQGAVQAQSGRFAVQRGDGLTRVAVYEGHAEIICEDGTRGHLQAGQRVCFSSHHIETAVPLADGDGAWVDGVIVAQGMRLADFVSELGRYHFGLIQCAPALAELRISGVFPVADTDHALDSLTRVLPVAVHRHTRYWVTVTAA